MISRRPRNRRIFFVAAIAVFSVFVLSSSGLWNSCGLEHVGILSDLETYERDLDPEFCESLVFRILEFNEQCDYDVEILDCG